MTRVQLKLETGEALGHTLLRMGWKAGDPVRLGDDLYEVVAVETYDPTASGLPEDGDDQEPAPVFIVRRLPPP